MAKSNINVKNKAFKELYWKHADYWNYFLEEYVSIASHRVNLRFLHYFNEIPYTRWPFYIGFSLFFVVYSFLLSLKRYEWVTSFYIPFLGIVLFLFFVYMWFHDMFLESSIFGKYNRKIRACLTYGFVLFILSEIFFFAGFFWAYFDRFFHPTAYVGGNSLPFGLHSLFRSTKSFLATLLLVSSGVFLNYGVYLLRIGSWIYPFFFFYLSTLLGLFFLVIQYFEYNYVLLFNVTDTVYSSLFYFLTGFHGLHVIVGLIMLLSSFTILGFRMFLTRQRHLLLLLSLFYWHFVDLIWIFLYLVVYIWNYNSCYAITFTNSQFQYLIDSLS